MAISGFHCGTLAFLFSQIALVGTGHAAGDDELGPGITGRVVLQLDGEPVRDAQVVFTGGAGISFETTSDRSGFFSLFLNESDTAIEADRSIPVSEAVAHFMGAKSRCGPSGPPRLRGRGLQRSGRDGGSGHLRRLNDQRPPGGPVRGSVRRGGARRNGPFPRNRSAHCIFMREVPAKRNRLPVRLTGTPCFDLRAASWFLSSGNLISYQYHISSI